MTNLVSCLLALGDRNLQLDRRDQAERLCHFAQALMAKREFAMALERFDAALALREDLAIAWAGRAEALCRQQRHKVALQSLNRACQHMQAPALVLMLAQAKLLCKLKQFEAVVNVCDEALSLSPRCWTAHCYRIYALCKLKCYGKLVPFGVVDALPLNLNSRLDAQSCPINLRSDRAKSGGFPKQAWLIP